MIEIINHPVSNKDNDKYVGLKISNNKIHFYYPESYSLSGIDDMKKYRNDVYSLLKTVALAKKLDSYQNNNSSSFEDEGELCLMSYMWIINDYLLNGIYINLESEFKVNGSGKINWKKTLDTQPIISQKSIIFNDLIVEQKSQVDNLIVSIHKYCVKVSMDIVGWLYKLNSKSINDEMFYSIASNKKKFIDVLSKEIDKTHDDSKRTRFNHMLNILKGVTGKTKSKNYDYGTENYFLAFEYMVDNIFGNVQNKKDFNPKGKWNLNIYNKPIDSSSLRPDTIAIDSKKNIVYIIDSKYYRFGTTGLISDLPSTTSIHKQITYGEFVKNKYQFSHHFNDINNVFIIPFNSEKNIFNTNNFMYYAGFASGDWIDETDNFSFNLIHTVLVDLKYIIKMYHNKNANCIDDLIVVLDNNK